MPDANSFDALIERFINERLTADELPQFFRMLENEGFRQRYADRIDVDLLEEAWLGWSHEQQAARLYNNILQTGSIPVSVTPVKRIGWTRYAAAASLFLLAGIAIYRYTAKKTVTHTPTTTIAQTPVIEDVPPGAEQGHPDPGGQVRPAAGQPYQWLIRIAGRYEDRQRR